MAKDDRPHTASGDDVWVAGQQSQAASQPRDQFSAMLRGSLLPTLVTGVVAVVLAAVVADGRAAWSAALGAGVVVVSSYLPEVLRSSDRILVMRDGRIAWQVDRRNASEELLLEAATGGAA